MRGTSAFRRSTDINSNVSAEFPAMITVVDNPPPRQNPEPQELVRPRTRPYGIQPVHGTAVRSLWPISWVWFSSCSYVRVRRIGNGGFKITGSRTSRMGAPDRSYILLPRVSCDDLVDMY